MSIDPFMHLYMCFVKHAQNKFWNFLDLHAVYQVYVPSVTSTSRCGRVGFPQTFSMRQQNLHRGYHDSVTYCIPFSIFCSGLQIFSESHFRTTGIHQPSDDVGKPLPTSVGRSGSREPGDVALGQRLLAYCLW